MNKNNKWPTILRILSLIISVTALVMSIAKYNASAEELILPDISTNVKTYTDYRCYNIDGSVQKYIQDNSITEEHGVRMFDGYLCVALGSAYGEVGDTFLVEFSNTMTVAVIMADEKADRDTDATNRYHFCPNYCGEDRACVVEFIVDKDKIPEDVSIYGSFDYCDMFQGDIRRLEYLGQHEDFKEMIK